MWRRLLEILQRPVSRTENLGQKLLRSLKNLFLSLVKWLRSPILILTGLLIIWMIGGNFLAALQEKKVDQALEEFAQQFPKTEPNNSAFKLAELGAGLGSTGLSSFNFLPTYNLYLPKSDAETKALEAIQEELGNYINSQIDKPNDEIDAPPESLSRYLASHVTQLDAVRTHVLNSDLPQGQPIDFRLLGVNTALPSFLNQANFQRILSLDMLEKIRLGQAQDALKTLEVSWKLNQALQKSPTLIAQLVVIIVAKPQAVIMRKMQEVPVEWQDRIERFNKYDFPQAVSTSFEGESFVLSRFARRSPSIQLFKVYDMNADGSLADNSSRLSKILVWFLDPLLQPYIRLIAVDDYERLKQVALQSPQQDLCSGNLGLLSQQPGVAPAWWNVFSDIQFLNQWTKVGKTILLMELTQKVLQVKEVGARQGNLPQQVPGIESSVCQDAKWVYQVSPEGTASISFSIDRELEWLERDDFGKSLQHHFKLQAVNSNSGSSG